MDSEKGHRPLRRRGITTHDADSGRLSMGHECSSPWGCVSSGSSKLLSGGLTGSERTKGRH